MLESDSHLLDPLSNWLQAYLQSALHLHLRLDPAAWDKTATLPPLLSTEFDFLHADILSVPCLFAVSKSSSDATPANLAKRHGQLLKHADGPVIFVFNHMSATARARLIEKGVAFVVPGNQLYIPSLAMDLREHFRARPVVASATLSPVAQVVLFRHLLAEDHEPWSPSGLAKNLRYSAMSIGRAFDELAAHGFAEVQVNGRSKHLMFADDRAAIFKQARPLLRSPVKSSHLFAAPALPRAFPYGGDMALSEQAMLNPPSLPRFAVGSKDWNTLQTGAFGSEVEYPEDANFSVDVWRYDPVIITGETNADPLSLYMQFHNHADERVAYALTHLMETVPWFREYISFARILPGMRPATT